MKYSHLIDDTYILQQIFREGNDVIAKMELHLDKAVYEKGRSLKNNEVDESDNSMVENVLKTSVTSGQVGALKVDPGFFVFESASCKYLYRIFVKLVTTMT